MSVLKSVPRSGRSARLPLNLGALEFEVGAAYRVLVVRERCHNPFHREPVAGLELAAAGDEQFELLRSYLVNGRFLYSGEADFAIAHC